MRDPNLVCARENLDDVKPGTCFYIYGHILKTCERFSINLVLNTPARDIALHINPRLPQNYIVRNCKINGSWGQEEVTSALAFILHRGDAFSVQILVTDTEFYISVNGKHFASFRHRLPYEKISRVEVKGDVSEIKIEQANVVDYPDRMNNLLDIIETVENLENCRSNSKLVSENIIFKISNFLIFFYSFQTLPYYGKLESPLKSGQIVHIHGCVKLLPHSFYINLQKGNTIWPHPIIPFHLNPRFANIGGRHVICRNSWVNGNWDQEERAEINIDFMPGKKFHLTINSCDTSYYVYLNEKFISEYQYRVNAAVDTIYIQGDIHLYNVYIEDTNRR